MWPAITQPTSNGTSRTEILLGTLVGGALVDWNGFKLINAAQSPSNWYGPYSPNCTASADVPPTINCDGGCLFNVHTDPGEHVNLRDTDPQLYRAMVARYHELAEELTANQPPTTWTSPSSGACDQMRKNGGFYGPWN